MIKLMDRQLILGYFKAYFICLTSLLGLYIVVDLFTNLDDFTHRNTPFIQVLQHIAIYYGYKVTQIFDRLCEAIVLLAAMFTITLMQRNNEQMPLLSAGVSTHRIVRPVLVCACFMLTLTVLNQELVIPQVADKLSYDKDDLDGSKNLSVHGVYEPNGILIEGKYASRKGLMIQQFTVTIPESVAGNLFHLEANEAHYHPKEKTWELTGARPIIASWDENVTLEVRESDDHTGMARYILHTKEVDFDALTRNNNWFLMASTYRLYEELQKPESPRLTAMAVLFHIRLTRPLLGLLLVFLGLSIILRDTTRNVILSAGACLVLCAVFFVVIYTCKMLGENDILPPPLAAWLPVLLFGPFAFVLFDAVQT
jgi:lipopolysaccharide export system permease protein